ncbi:MAG TPA: NAD(P)H-dependent oxidoreductase [Chloroflexota bacterium]|nr:NAD(P)H-dependent oxidoreductase [Chloroflexota bacterium]
MSNERLRVAVIVGSTRATRFADTIVRWFNSQVEQRDDLTLDVIDLRDTPLPTVQQSESMAGSNYVSPDVQRFAARLGIADAFLVVTPEYNHGYPASLKLAIDSVHQEWKAKPVGFISYGGSSGGLRAVEQLRTVFSEMHTVTVRDAVSFHFARTQFDDNGEPRDPNRANSAAKRLLDELVWWARILHEARTRAPYIW